MSLLADKLARRIKKEFGLEVEPVIQRTYAGHWQRSMGTWSWSMRGSRVGCVASHYPATELVRAKKWDHSIDGLDIVIYPATKN
jgi:hypothetical protein